MKIDFHVRRFISSACFALFAVSASAPAQESTPAISVQAPVTMDRNAYLHYLLALRFANEGITYAALHEAAASLRVQTINNPAAGIAFQLITSQRQDTHLRLCCFQAKIIAARYSTDGTHILTALDDKTIRVWDAATGHPLADPMKHEADILDVAWSADGTRIASSSRDGKVHLWDATSGKLVRQPFVVEQPITHLAVSPNGEFILGSHKGAISVWNTKTGAVVSPKPYHDDINVLSFSNDGKYALIATNDDAADIVDPATAKRLHRLSPGNAVFHGSFSNDSRFALTASEDHTAQIWDASTGAAKGTSFRHSATVSDAEFNRDGTLVLTTSYDHSARVWDAQTGRALTPPMQHSAPVVQGGFSADGSLMFTRSRDKMVHLWSVATGEPATTPIQNISEHSDVAFSPTEPKLLVAIDNAVEIVDVVPGETVPTWLADLADFEASRSRFDQTPVQNRETIEALRKSVLTSNDSDRWSQFARWYFTAPQERTVSPWSSVSLAQYVDELIHMNTPDSLAYAAQISARHPAWLLRIEREKKLRVGDGR
ncbi:MAG TPA: WD40 repeat domain-containing protein [Terriglobus sp.]